MISIKTNIDKFVKTEMKRYQSAIKTASISTSNKLAKQGLVEAKRQIRAEYSVKLSDLNKDSRGNRLMYTENTRANNHPSKIVAVATGISLGKFKAKQKKTGVEVQVHKGVRKLVKGVFGPKIQRLGKGVFTREDPKSPGKISKRLPIFRLYGPSPARMIQYKSINEKVNKYIVSRYKIVLGQELRYRLSK